MINRLSAGERRLLLLALVVLGPLFLFRVVVFPLLDLKSSYQSKALGLTEKINQTHLLGQELVARQRATPTVPEGINGRINRVLRNLGVLDRASLASQNAEGGVQSLLVQLDGLTLYEATQVIYQIEHLRPSVQIEHLDLQVSFQNSKRLKLNLVVSGG